jgi:RNA polymerase sigma-70 factor (ECF subfamily)
MDSIETQGRDQAFNAFVHTAGTRLRRVMTSQYGVDVGCDSTDSALAWAWEHWDRVHAMNNPAGYVYRVAQTHARRALRGGRPVTLPPECSPANPDEQVGVDGDLVDALQALPERQRLAVILVHVHGWTPAEVADFTGTPAVTVRSHLRRGLRALRRTLSKGPTR